MDVSSLISSKKRKVITGVVYTTDKSRYHFFDKDRKELQDTLEKFFPGYEVAVTGMDDDERRATVRIYGEATAQSPSPPRPTPMSSPARPISSSPPAR